jgi:hypothetical protein
VSSQQPADRALTVAAYAALFLFGLAQALLGAFFYASGPGPLAAIGFGAAILATCLLGGWGTGSPIGGLAPAVGWFALTFLLANGTSNGSVVITATTAGEWFLFGGSVCAAVGVVACFAVWSGSAKSRPRALRSRVADELANRN